MLITRLYIADILNLSRILLTCADGKWTPSPNIAWVHQKNLYITYGYWVSNNLIKIHFVFQLCLPHDNLIEHHKLSTYSQTPSNTRNLFVSTYLWHSICVLLAATHAIFGLAACRAIYANMINICAEIYNLLVILS